MQDKFIENMDQEIGEIMRALGRIGPMRPGGLTQQYHNSAEKLGGYWQLSYTHRGRSYSENVREAELEQVRAEMEQYRQFKELCGRWVDLSVERARRERELNRQASRESKGRR
jgi:hypothetical protein